MNPSWLVYTCAQMALDSPISATLAPHPALPRYYESVTQKRQFVRGIFDQTAPDYERVERTIALGTGSRYRGQALLRAGLQSGMRVLDVAVGTGLVAREAAHIVGSPSLVLGVDPSSGMLAEAVAKLSIRVVQGVGEQLPLAADQFDFLSMGYALRHLGDLRAAFQEFHRVLKPGGRVCVLEITRPRRRWANWMLRWYMKSAAPLAARILARSVQSPKLWQYYWDTTENCVSPQDVISAMTDAGLVEGQRRIEMGIFSEYTARKPG